MNSFRIKQITTTHDVSGVEIKFMEMQKLMLSISKYFQDDNFMLTICIVRARRM